ncbi:MAG: helix-turn-helix domain-containing protein [Candidatus Dormibacteraceae bacterium]
MEPHDWREARRLRAWELFQRGWTQREIADAFGVTSGAVSQWIKRGRVGGHAGLRHAPRPVRPRSWPPPNGRTCSSCSPRAPRASASGATGGPLRASPR